MLVVDVNEFYSPTGGGVRTYIDRKMAIMADLGHELVCIACGKEDRVEERAGGGKVIYVKSPGLPFDKNYGLFSRYEPIWRWLDQLPGGRRVRLTPKSVSPPALPSRCRMRSRQGASNGGG